MAAGGGRSEPAKFRAKITIFRRLERRPISGEGWVVTPRPSRIDRLHYQHDALKGRSAREKTPKYSPSPQAMEDPYKQDDQPPILPPMRTQRRKVPFRDGTHLIPTT
ncbi:hypothetical protein L3X38_012428 [Prunus dulcis]|uniref:Uncharacterized protein n=1 Tax=Prunus dulcis TaxID=3755 RepID=A0AAD4WLR0_PRUDU|nr:hypothetical protein L3X38_012428 [Prunus dulcis]